MHFFPSAAIEGQSERAAGRHLLKHFFPSAVIAGQRPADKPAQGNALGKTAKTAPALKGRRIRCFALSGLDR